ncbi:MAG: zinc ribbon domain-containing protein, partial [Thermoleophilaceae bacterium]|nr:zinc ribbon domain-containing protein [Thermoleophilaceae bacterium]
MASTDTPNSRAAELAAEQVESILVAAEAAAQRLRDEAAAEAGRVRATAEEEARAVERAAQDAR